MSPLTPPNRATTIALVTSFATLVVAIVFAILISNEQANIRAALAASERDALRSETATYLADRGLCALRDTYDHQIQSSLDFLAHHPAGIPGIPRSLILQGVKDNRLRREALADVSCPPSKP